MKSRSNPFLVATFVFVSAASLQAATLFWDGNDTTADADGGPGTWDTVVTNLNWNTAATAGTPVSWPAASTGDDDASFGVTGGAVTIAGGGVTANSIAFESGGYSLSGGTLTLDGSSPGIATNGNATIHSIIEGSAGLNKTGAETLILTAANNYTGTTNIGAGTLSLSGGSNRLATAGSLAFSGDGTLDLGANPQTLANLSIATAIAGTKGTLINGSLTFDGASALTITPSVTTGGITAEVDASGLSSLTLSKTDQIITVGGRAGGTTPGNSGMFKLSAVTNSITASAINIGTTGAANATGVINKGDMELGAANTLNANTWTLGTTRDGGIVRFRAGLESPSVTLRGQDGTSAVTTITIGQNAAGGTTVGTSSFELAAGSVDVLVNDLVISRGASTSSTTNTPSVNGYFSIGGGTLEATNIWLSKNDAGGRNTTNTSHLYQLAGDVKVANLIFGTTTFAGTGGPAFNSQYTLTTGTLRAGDIRAGTGVFASSTRRINFNGGTITHYDAASDLSINGVTGTGGAIGIALGTDGTPAIDVATGRTVTLGTFTSLSGAGSLSKTGPGQLTMNNTTNTAGGEFRPVEGSVVVGASNALAGQLVVLDPDDSGTLSFNGTTAIALGGLGGSRDLSVLNDSSATQDLTLGNASSAEYTGEITGARSIRKIGGGTQTYHPGLLHTASLLGLNTSGGTLELNSGDYTVSGSATPGQPDSTSGFIVSRGGTFRLNGANVTLTGGSFVIPSGNTGGNGNNFILDEGTFDGGNREVLHAYGSSGAFTMNGGLFIGGEFRISQSAVGTVNLNGGILRVLNLKHNNNTEIVNFDGGTLQAKEDRADFITASVDQVNIRAGGAVIDSNGFSVTIPKLLTEDSGSTGGGLTKIGAGDLTLTGANAYTGPTLVNEGSLIVNADHTAATGAVTVGDGSGDVGSAVFGGTGLIPGAITLASDGAIAPGALAGPSAGTLTASANVSGNGSLLVEVDGATADQLIVGGTLNISAMTLDLATINAPTDTVYVIVNAASAITGAEFAGVNGNIPGYEVIYNYDDGVDTHNIALVGTPVANPFVTWATITHGLAGGDAAATADPDFDGLDNAVEFVIGGQPNPANPNANSSDLAPTVSSTASHLVFTFRRTDLALTQPGIVIAAEYGSDLAGWTTATHGDNGVVIVETNDIETGVDQVQVSIPRILETDAKMFARLNVVVP